MTSDYSFGIFWPLYCLSFHLWLLVIPLVSFGHYIVCPLIYDFWLLLWYLLAIILSVLWFMTSDYSFGIFWPLYCLSFDLWLLITPLVSFGHYIVCPLIYDFWLLLLVFLQTFHTHKNLVGFQLVLTLYIIFTFSVLWDPSLLVFFTFHSRWAIQAHANL
jgi:hypothetical protein